MKKLLIPQVAALLLATANAASAQQYENYMPIKPGSEWTASSTSRPDRGLSRRPARRIAKPQYLGHLAS
ncbi:MAG: hypothetical protein HYY17_07345 [Planctomycetes bacterium]|nr:hypothetical protein [Planctomycetota bacterium]